MSTATAVFLGIPHSVWLLPRLRTASSPRFVFGQRVRHVSTGAIYRIVDLPTRCRIDATGEPAYSYCLDRNSDITLHVCPQSEMEDGRFVPLVSDRFEQART